jgi:molecular chaperone Hsp33
MERPLGEELARGRGPLDVLGGLLEGAPLYAAETYPLRASCRCGKTLLSSLLLSLPVDELESMAREDGGAEVTCSFCTKHYHFSEVELRSMIDKMRLH